MVKYLFHLQVKGLNDEYIYVLDLNSKQENSPEQIFNNQMRENMRNQLQNQSLCAIKDNHLNQIIQTWVQDIREGYRDSTLTLSLPLLIESNLEKLHEQGNQETPTIISPNLSEIEPILGALPPLNFS
ncbi:hypothetical protein NIES37_38100 [Tolypothrix tenuis PCC 7101]|uniref:Uncharacterized protein n=1 Tax=Tolypothrix tenuis PCC 7101 TaxID=231146 RepID=A0A1Z4N278_9CYAN|nr:hypothetical protein [Aulosira sp. FACHB-113]BAY99827.1 hypothetical protein NIES37_38100 [Tolypothrix tenuis PCC 7101]BAZ76251.1 hypothetical protein NIES50_48490 [Aulosira laxa NIES-50]